MKTWLAYVRSTDNTLSTFETQVKSWMNVYLTFWTGANQIAERFYSRHLPGLLTTGDSEMTSRSAILLNKCNYIENLHKKSHHLAMKGQISGFVYSPYICVLLVPNSSHSQYFLLGFLSFYSKSSNQYWVFQTGFGQS